MADVVTQQHPRSCTLQGAAAHVRNRAFMLLADTIIRHAKITLAQHEQCAFRAVPDKLCLLARLLDVEGLTVEADVIDDCLCYVRGQGCLGGRFAVLDT